MKCKRCQHTVTKVLESRESKDGSTIRRRRECVECGFRFTTFEREEEKPLYITKKDGSRQLFNREKLTRSLALACQKRTAINAENLEGVVDEVKRTIEEVPGREIASTTLGDVVLNALRELDAVAYVRFASVYRAFSSLDDFVQELTELENKSKENITRSSTDVEPPVKEQL